MTSCPAAIPRQRVLRILWILSTAGLALVIGVLTLMSAGNAAPSFAYSDKFYHMAAFAALVFPTTVLQPRLSLWVGLAALIYGGAIELIQPHVGREAEWSDLFADGIGICIGIITGYLLRRLVQFFHGPVA